MKPFIVLTLILTTFLIAVACQQTNKDDNQQDNDGKVKYFASADSAVLKAKSDLLQVLRSNKEINLGLNAATLERAQPAAAVKQFQVTFEALNKADSTGGWGDLTPNRMSDIIPLVADNSVATIVEIAHDEKQGYSIASLAAKDVTDDLNIVRRANGDTSRGEITIYNLPNERTRIYSVRVNNAEMFFTNYPGFNIQQPVPAQRLISVLKRDAAVFQKENAEALKNKKLVH